jgi:hypothetical protein
LRKIACAKAGHRIDDFGFDRNAARRCCRHKIAQQLFFLFAFARRCMRLRQPVSEPQASQATEQAVITHKAGSDEKDVNIWKRIVFAKPQSSVSKETAIFVARVLLPHVLGFKGHRVEVNFGTDPIAMEELFALLEKLCGGQLAQKLGATDAYRFLAVGLIGLSGLTVGIGGTS